jgi:hypothetical protein
MLGDLFDRFWVACCRAKAGIAGEEDGGVGLLAETLEEILEELVCLEEYC